MRISNVFRAKKVVFAGSPQGVRVIRKFLFIPLVLDNEMRWLEYSNLVQVAYRDEWVNVNFTEIDPC